MRKSRRLIVFFLLLFLGTNNYVHTAVYYAFNGESSASITSPDVYLEEGTAGTGVVYPNATSAAWQVDSHATTFYPNDYNVTQGTYASGATPSDVSTFDNTYFIVNSSGSDTSAATYYPSSYNTLGETSHVGGSLGNLTIDDGVKAVFQSYYFLNNTEDYVDNNVSDVDSVSNIGTFSNFTAQQNGPDSIVDTLTEEMVIISTIYDYIDVNTSDVDSVTGSGTHTDFNAQKVGPDSIYDTLTEENMVVPTTVYDGIYSHATQTETSRKVFRNPRGLMHYYTFFLNNSGISLDLIYCNSSDGSTWSPPMTVSSTSGFNITSYSIEYMEDPVGQGLSVYIAFTSGDNSNDVGSLLFRSGFIYDNVGTITFNATQRLRNGTNKQKNTKAVITRDKNNYLWIVFEYTQDWNKKDFDVLCTWSDDPAPALSPAFATAVTVDSSSNWPEQQYITAVPLTGAFGDVGIIWNYNNVTLKAVYGNYSDQGSPDFGTIMTLDATLDYFLLSSVTDETTNDVHILYKDGATLKHVNWTVGTGFGTPDTVYSGSVESLSISVDRTSSPNNLYAFYVQSAASSISYKNTTVDSINWSNEQKIVDTEEIDYISASSVDSNNDRLIQLVYTTDTNKLVRFVDRQAKYEINLEEQATNISTKEDVTRLCIYAGATAAENLGVCIWNTTSNTWDSLVNDIFANGWTNITITDYVASTLTFQFKGGTESQDIKIDSWQIDAFLLYQYNYTYQLDMEVQWTDLIHDRVNEYLCINGGNMGAEDILVDVWYNSTWNNVLSDLSSGWNNISINTYLDSPTCTIRFQGGDETHEYIQSSWEIDASLLHLWSNEQVTELELEGSSNLYSWTQLEWLLDTSWTTDSVKVLFQLYDYNSMVYPSSGDGYIRYISGIADVDETKSQVITTNPEYYRNDTGWWNVKIRGVKVTGVQYNLGIDLSYLESTYYDQYMAQTEFIFTDVTDNLSPNLNFTVINYNSITNVNMTIQVYNYTSGSYPTSGQGYLNYISNWLAGWDQRVKLTIDHNDVDSDLSDFPALIHLSTSSGRNDDDVSFVFDELQNDANRLKIAVTTGDGATQCYVEIEEWDDANEEAWLWVKVPSLNSTTDTELYLYYDADHADNTAYVGDPNSSPAEAVWDDDFRFVSHMRDDPDTSHIRDSTGYDNDGTKTGANEPVVTIGNVSDAQDFDGGDDIVDVTDDASMNIRTSLTMEAWVNATVYDPQFNDVMSKRYYDIYTEDGRLGAYFDTDAGIYDDWPGGSIRMVVDTWYYLAVTYDSGAIAGYIDGALDGTDSRGTTIDDSTGWDFIIGWHNDTNRIHWEGIIDEVRVSNTSRSGDWIETSFESGRDDLVDFGGEDTYTKWLNITNNDQSCLSGSYARIRVTSVYSTTEYYQQLTNFVRLLQEESILVNDYALRVTNNGTDLYTVRLVRISDSNIDRISNCTIYFRSGETQLQVIDGTFTLTTGTWANLPATSSLDILIETSTVHLQYVSVIDAELEVLRSGTSIYTKYPIQFTIT